MGRAIGDISRMATILKGLPRIGSKLKSKLKVPGLGDVSLGEDIANLLPSSARKLDERTQGRAKETDYDLDDDGVADLTRTDDSLHGQPYVILRSSKTNPAKGNFVIYGGTDGRVHLIDQQLESGDVIVIGDKTANFDGAFFATISPSNEHFAHLTDRNADGAIDLITWRSKGKAHFRSDDDFDGKTDRQGEGDFRPSGQPQRQRF